MNVLSLFDGISCGQLALKRANIPYSNYFSSEIVPSVIEVTQSNFPNTIQVGDMKLITKDNVPHIDLLMGGSPCHCFSFLGKRTGMATTDDIEIDSLEKYLDIKEQNYEFEGYSYLFWEFVRLVKELKPKYFFLENVMMDKRWSNVISKALGVNPIMIQSSLVSAQSRERLYWTNIGLEPQGLFGFLESIIPPPKNKYIYLKDIVGIPDSKWLTNGIAMKKDITKVRVRKNKIDIEALKLLLKSHKNKTIKEIAERLNINKTTVDHWFRNDNCFSIPEAEIWLDLKVLLNITDTTFDNAIMDYEIKDNVFDIANRVYHISGKSPTLTAGTTNIRFIDDDGNIDVLNSEHCEQLQNIPIGYTKLLPENVARSRISRGWTIDVVAHIFSYIR